MFGSHVFKKGKKKNTRLSYYNGNSVPKEHFKIPNCDKKILIPLRIVINTKMFILLKL